MYKGGLRGLGALYCGPWANIILVRIALCKLLPLWGHCAALRGLTTGWWGAACERCCSAGTTGQLSIATVS